MPNPPTESPWRAVFESLRALVGNRRDEHGALGSINWLRVRMSERGANPNVVRNIIYRDKGKLADKRALFDIVTTLWALYSDVPLQAPELEALLATDGGAEQDAQLLGGEKRRAYSAFVSGVRAGQSPKVLITGRPGSGKTLLLDHVQQALELPPRTAKTVRLEFGADLSAGLTRLAVALGTPREVAEAKLVKAAAQSAFAVQADAQAEVARSLLEAARAHKGPLVLLVHLSQALAEQRSLGAVDLRLNTPDVPRVSAAEWLWLGVLEPLSRLGSLSLLVSAATLPLRAAQAVGGFEEPVKLKPPTAAEARRFVRARLPQLDDAQQEAVVQRSGRSFEELRTLTLLATLREPGLARSNKSESGDSQSTGFHSTVFQDGRSEHDSRHGGPEHSRPEHGDAEYSFNHSDSEPTAQLGRLLDTAGDARLRDFLCALAVVSLPDFPAFSEQALNTVRDGTQARLSGLEVAFLDPVPGREDVYRPFSRQFARVLRGRFKAGQGKAYRTFHRKAAAFYETAAQDDPGGETAARYLHHLFEARDWDALYGWSQTLSVPQTLLHRLWTAAAAELLSGEVLERLAVQVAMHYVRLGSYSHPDALRAFEMLDRSRQDDLRLWTLLKRAEGAVLKGQIEVAETLLQGWSESASAGLKVEHGLLTASLARWHSDLPRAADIVAETVRPLLSEVPDDASGRLIHAKVAVWAGLIAKDDGDLEGALRDFGSVASADDLVSARVAFQRGDVLLHLGRFDAALAALDEAVTRARRSEALAQEQSRYLARRGSVQRLRGQWAAAATDFELALSGLAVWADDGLEQAFWRAKVEDERALLLLAQGDFSAAVVRLKRNREVFSRYEVSYRVDAGYRILRSGLRLALAYGLRGLGQPYRLPFARAAGSVENADLRHARRLVRDVGAAVEARAAHRAAYETLQRETLLVGSLLAASPNEAATLAKRAAAAARFAYQQAQACVYLATAELRANEPEAALTTARRGLAAFTEANRRGEPGERGDLGLRAWLQALELQALVAKGDVAAGLEYTLTSLQSLQQDYREPLLRVLGESLETALGDEARRHPAVTRLFGDALSDETLRLPDAFVACADTLSTFVVTVA